MPQPAGTVYLVTHSHIHPDLFAGRSASFIGVFSSEEKAETSMQRHALLPGFKESSEGFTIHRIELDNLLTDPIEIWE